MPISALVTDLTQRDDQESSDATVETEIGCIIFTSQNSQMTGVIEYDQSTQQAAYTAPPQVDALLDQMLVTVSSGEQDPRYRSSGCWQRSSMYSARIP